MAAVHDISLTENASGMVAAAVALAVSGRARRDRVHDFHADAWEVELRRGREFVVARTSQALTGPALLDAAIDIAHRALDIASVEDGDHLTTRAPADNHLRFECADGCRVVRFQGVSDLSIDVTACITRIRADGTIEPDPVRPPLTWTPALRFYRLSQSNRDLFEAYRNLFLGLEALLDQLFPKGRSEGERNWLLRAVAAAGARIDLASLATPGVPDPARDLVDRVYRVRLCLFHAKTGRTMLPDERISYTAVAEVYPVLVRLWSEIARAFLSVRGGGGGVSYHGFRNMIEAAFTGIRVGVTADTTPPNESETSASPLGLPHYIFSDPISVAEIRPGRMALSARTNISDLPKGQIIGRVVGLLPDDRPATINNITGGLTLDGLDHFEVSVVLRLVNLGQARAESA